MHFVFLFFLITNFSLSAEANIIEDPDDERKLVENHSVEKLRFGLANHIHYYKVKKTKNTVVEQRSGRKRLFDHNLILKALFQGNLYHKEFGNLSQLFQNATFIDFGSAILYEEGAVTVRDIYEDEFLRNSFYRIVATDINDPSFDHTRYIEIHLYERDPFPFSFNEIPLLLDDPAYIRILTKNYSESESSPIIFRSTNSGPDLFYTVEEMKEHFRAILEANPQRNILYFFNRFVFFRSVCRNQFQLIGTIDEKIGVNHSFSAWRFVDWNRRSYSESFRPNREYIRTLKEGPIALGDEWDQFLYRQACQIRHNVRYFSNKFRKSITKE
ncbi:hypothetical protein LPTSP4_29400 [Leptospira ryugenii]|uniref:Uncharacterized protein n=1 Tax=Leptospira ryugenii TaxID=1917863 RepID=A0A2P2E3J6_9LEPT|nr:hypothetical protein [Leptospira ryugenii]GBF51404.1 hypothetical protein LPTSP4_29400 [Leptospira ryugenii]